MPFLTEEIWQTIAVREKDNALIVGEWPKLKAFDSKIIEEFNKTIEVISGIRTIRKDKNIAFKDAIELKVLQTTEPNKYFDCIIKKLGNCETIAYVTENVEGAISFRANTEEYFVPLAGNIDVGAEIEKLTQELQYNQGFLKSVQAKLSNEKFVAGAPEKVIEMERKKESDALSKIETLMQSIANLK
jgi:valyl-tRNA synthetase